MTWKQRERITGADKLDRASALEEMERQEALKHRWPAGPAATGRCLHCGIKLPASETLPRRWCDADCRDAWEREQ